MHGHPDVTEHHRGVTLETAELRPLHRRALERAAELVLRDHDPFAPRTVDRLIDLARANRAATIVVTEKDWSKLRRVPAERWPCPVARPQLTIRLDEGGESLSSAVLAAAAQPSD